MGLGGPPRAICIKVRLYGPKSGRCLIGGWTGGVAGGGFGCPSTSDVREWGGGGAQGAVLRFVGLRPALAMFSSLTARVAFLEGIWGQHGAVDGGVLSAPP